MLYDKEQLLNLPVKERFELVMDLWESIDDDLLGKEMTRQGFEEEIDKRIERIEKNPEILISWEEVLKQMQA